MILYWYSRYGALHVDDLMDTVEQCVNRAYFEVDDNIAGPFCIEVTTMLGSMFIDPKTHPRWAEVEREETERRVLSREKRKDHPPWFVKVTLGHAHGLGSQWTTYDSAPDRDEALKMAEPLIAALGPERVKVEQ